MKKLAILLTLLIGFALSAFSQGTIVDPITLPAIQLNGYKATATVYSPLLDQYWDYSAQFKSTFYGLGDSTHWRVQTYQTNDPNQTVWNELTEKHDTLASKVNDSGLITTITDFGGMWAKHVFTSMSLDTVTITPYIVRKQKRSRFF